MTPFNHDSIATLPRDPDVRDVAEYVAGVMTDAQAEAFEERLATDDALFERVGPFLEAWVFPLPVPAEVEIGRAIERQRAVARRTRRATRVAGLLAAAAAVLFAIMQAGSRVGPAVVPMVAHDTGPKPSPASVKAGPASSKMTTVQHRAPKHATPREAPQATVVAAAATPKTVDTAAQRPTVMAAANTDSAVAPPVIAVVPVDTAKRDSTPAKGDSTTAKVDSTAAARRDSQLAKVDTTYGQRQGTEVINAKATPKNGRWWWPFGRPHRNKSRGMRPPTLNPGQVL